ncbi:tRNA pseudouridine(55) synthase TruB [Brachybacterium sp. DNPG3]
MSTLHGGRRDPAAPAPHGILLVDKAAGRTSHDVVARVRWLLGTKKVGHAGTLDPMATGLLVLGVGQGTRLLTQLVGLDKVYAATIRLGLATTTDDAEGEPLGEPVDATDLTARAIEEGIDALRGDIQQVPSTVSAIKIDGKRAYARARAGEDVELAPRPVTIRRFETTALRAVGPFVDIDVVVACTSGTYVRALARDLGRALGVGGHLTALRRTEVGPFQVEDAALVPGRGEGDDVELPLAGLGATAARVLAGILVDDAGAADLAHGKRISRASATGPVEPAHPVPRAKDGGERPVAALDRQGRLCALVHRERTAWAPDVVIPPDARS